MSISIEDQFWPDVLDWKSHVWWHGFNVEVILPLRKKYKTWDPEYPDEEGEWVDGNYDSYFKQLQTFIPRLNNGMFPQPTKPKQPRHNIKINSIFMLDFHAESPRVIGYLAATGVWESKSYPSKIITINQKPNAKHPPRKPLRNLFDTEDFNALGHVIDKAWYTGSQEFAKSGGTMGPIRGTPYYFTPLKHPSVLLYQLGEQPGCRSSQENNPEVIAQKKEEEIKRSTMVSLDHLFEEIGGEEPLPEPNSVFADTPRNRHYGLIK